jgi:hypothetical protein
MAQIMAKVKGLATHMTSLYEKVALHNKTTDQKLKAIEVWMNSLDGSVSEASTGTLTKRSAGGSPLLKVGHCTI